MSAQFAMLIVPSSIPPALPGDADAVPDPGLAARVLSGPGLWLDWLEELDRASLLEELLACDAISQALAEAPHWHAYLLHAERQDDRDRHPRGLPVPRPGL